MSNPLVAPTQDSTKAYSGISLLETANDLKSAIESGDWASVAMGAVGTALDALSMAMDPFGAILAAGVGWLIEHVGPLKEALNGLTGNADEIAAQSETWKNVAGELQSVGTDLGDLVKADLQAWTGPAADAYRQRTQDTVTLLETAQKGCEGASNGVKTAGEVVAAVRALVRDIIAELVGHLISWALQVVFTLGIGLTWVVPQVVAAVAKTASKIADITTRLVKALKALMPLLKRAGDLFGDAAKALKNIKPGKVSAPPKGPKIDGTPKAPEPKPKGGGDGTTTSGAHGNPPGNGGPPPKGDGTTPAGTGPHGDPPPAGSGGAPGGGSRGGPDGSSGGGGPRPSSAKPENPRDTAPTPDNRVCKDDPVDIASGEVILEQRDLALGSLVLTRTHVSTYRAGHWFGPSWSSTVDQRLEVDDEHVCYFSPVGSILVYPRGDGEQLPLEGARWPLTRDGDTFTLVTDDEVLEFSGSGPVVPLRAFEGEQRVEVFYDDFGAPALLRREDGVRVALRTSRGRVTELVVLGEGLPDVTVLKYDHDARGHLSAVTNSSGQAQRFGYDEAGRLEAWEDRNGVHYGYTYDDRGRCVRTTGDGGFLDGAFAYGDHVTRHTDSLGHVTEFHLNDARQVVREVDPAGGVTLSEWDRYDRLLSRTDPLGRTTRYGYDEGGALSEVHRADGSVVRLEDGPAAIAVQDGDTTWRRRYEDDAPDPRTAPVGVATPISFGGEEPPAPEGVEPDQFGRPRVLPRADGAVALGWTVEGRRAVRVGPRQERATWRYDGEGNEIEHVDELGRVTRREYGPFDVLTAIVEPSGARTVYGYDTELRLTSVTNPQGRTWTYRYDELGRLRAQTDFAGRTRSYAYDAAGQLVRATDPAGQVTTYHHDVLGNLVEVRAPERTTTYAYDPVGHLVRAANGESTVEFERDAFGRVVRETVDGRSVTFEYDESGYLHRRTPGGAESTWFFDDLDRPVGLLAGAHALAYRHDTASRVIGRQAGPARLEQTFGGNGELVTQTVTAGDVPVQRRTFGHRADGALASLRDDVTGATSLTRDAAGRVVGVTSATGREEYRYDLAGTLVPPVGFPVTEDEHGRRTTHGAVRFTWSGDRLTTAATADGTVWRYHYDPLGRRIGKSRHGADGTTATTIYTWDGTTLIEEAAPGRIVTWDHLPGTVTPVVQRERDDRGTRTRTFVTDAVGTPTDLLDERGALVWTSRRTAHGGERTAAPTPLRFPGQYADAETGLHYNVFRYYDPVTARYLSQDPLGLEPGPDPYAYVPDPYAEFDALGLMNCSTTSQSTGGGGAPQTPKGGHDAGNTGGSADKPTPPPVPPRSSKPKLGPNGKPIVPPKPGAKPGNTAPASSKPAPPPVPPRDTKPKIDTPAQPKPDAPGPSQPKPEPGGAPGTAGNPGPKPPAGKTDFHQPGPGAPSKLQGEYTFKPEPQKISGSQYGDVTPMQEHVFQGVIDSKIAKWKQDGLMDTPVDIKVYYPPGSNQLKLAGDGHHSFAAAMESGRPINLQLWKQPGGGLANPQTSWTNTTALPGVPKPGQWQK
ncbi:RHS repeat-associated core domain-containing protein [Amycolatopsis pretoriensis]|uniref:RHS repeat-associated core domain-containing protein n=1 Tax=Amycolatopsis pretoriensis TaxID=218821 RepID=A0A1H5QEH7_9PSEU|nr:RHS repeat-associated core domain-containing protein [Amycolatopsis pretoriensis]SEF24244.1 RHS repeat-associated core domain-containing protein [Amycolatopsis pretoriensis]